MIVHGRGRQNRGRAASVPIRPVNPRLVLRVVVGQQFLFIFFFSAVPKKRNEMERCSRDDVREIVRKKINREGIILGVIIIVY